MNLKEKVKRRRKRITRKERKGSLDKKKCKKK